MAEIDHEKKTAAIEPVRAQDIESGNVSGEVQVDKNGFKLFPQPVQGDKLDPLNWTSLQKHGILGIVMALLARMYGSHANKRLINPQVLHVHVYHDHDRACLSRVDGSVQR